MLLRNSVSRLKMQGMQSVGDMTVHIDVFEMVGFGNISHQQLLAVFAVPMGQGTLQEPIPVSSRQLKTRQSKLRLLNPRSVACLDLEMPFHVQWAPLFGLALPSLRVHVRLRTHCSTPAR